VIYALTVDREWVHHELACGQQADDIPIARVSPGRFRARAEFPNGIETSCFGMHSHDPVPWDPAPFLAELRERLEDEDDELEFMHRTVNPIIRRAFPSAGTHVVASTDRRSEEETEEG
jgi:hypothetical protein